MVAALGVFPPCYLLVVIPAPYFRRFAGNPRLRALVDCVTAAATGAIARAAFVRGRRAIIDLSTAFIALATMLILLKTKRIPEPVVILAVGAVGLALHRWKAFQRIFRLPVHNVPMTSRCWTTLSCIGLLALLLDPLRAEIPQAQRAKIDELTGVKGTYTAEEDVYRVAFPRTDVKVAVEGRPMHPFLGLTSWAAFSPSSHGGLMVMGDLVLFEDEVNPVMSAALDNGLELTALTTISSSNPRV